MNENDVLEFIRQSNKEDLQNLGNDGLLEILEQLGISREKCIWKQDQNGVFCLWVPFAEAEKIIRVVNPGKTVADGYVHNRVASGDIQVMLLASHSRLYNVVDLLKVVVWTEGKKRKLNPDRKKRDFTEEDINKLRLAQYSRRAREQNISLDEYLAQRKHV